MIYQVIGACKMERLKTILRYMTPIHTTYFVHYINLSLHIKRMTQQGHFEKEVKNISRKPSSYKTCKYFLASTFSQDLNLTLVSYKSHTYIIFDKIRFWGNGEERFVTLLKVRLKSILFPHILFL